jgi:hypothetical protein
MPDNPADRDPDEPDAPREEPELDFEAEFSRLIADWGPTPDVEEVRKEARPSPPPASSDDSLKRLLRQAWPDEQPTRPAAEDEAHFEPPPPPPIPRPEPRRLAAWIALFGAPILGLLLLVSPLAMPSYVGYGLFVSFVGGFGYLVWTMGAGRGHDGWDDGARL